MGILKVRSAGVPVTDRVWSLDLQGSSARHNSVRLRERSADAAPGGAIKARQTNIGPGAFVRLFPIDFLYVQAQYEHNFINYKYIPQAGGGTFKDKFDVNSFLLGAGYSSGRGGGSNTYYYLSVMFDVAQLPNSPYVDSYGRLVPIIRAGFNVGLFQGRQKRNRE